MTGRPRMRSTTRTGNPMWVDRQGRPLLERFSDVGIRADQRNVDVGVASAANAAPQVGPQQFGLDLNRGVFDARVQVRLSRANGGTNFIDQLDSLALNMQHHTAILTNAWDGGGAWFARRSLPAEPRNRQRPRLGAGALHGLVRRARAGVPGHHPADHAARGVREQLDRRISISTISWTRPSPKTFRMAEIPWVSRGWSADDRQSCASARMGAGDGLRCGLRMRRRFPGQRPRFPRMRRSRVPARSWP